MKEYSNPSVKKPLFRLLFLPLLFIALWQYRCSGPADVSEFSDEKGRQEKNISEDLREIPSDIEKISTDGGGGDAGTSDRAPERQTADDTPPTAGECHPYNQGYCLLPFPSSYYLVKDPKTRTGFRVNLPPKLPISFKEGGLKIPLKPKLFNWRDGFSPNTQILAYFKDRVDPKTLIKSSQIDKSVQPDSPIQLIEFQTGRRIPLMAEVDLTVKSGEPQVLIIRPMVRLKPKSRYAVAILKSVKAVGGKELDRPELFDRFLRGEKPKTPTEKLLYQLHSDTIKTLEKAGLKRENLLLAWDFRTASDEQLFEEMLYLRDTMFKALPSDGPNFQFTLEKKPTVKEDPHISIYLEGTLEVPSFLKDDVFNTMLRDPNTGRPKIRGAGKFPLIVLVPRCAEKAAGPIPVLVFGHGLFGGAKGEMLSGYQRFLSQELCMVQVGTDWLGVTRNDAAFVALKILPDMNLMQVMSDRLKQGHLNFMALLRLVRGKLKDSPKLQINGKPVIDGKKVYYLGISNGAIQGGTLMALSPDVERGVLNVGGANWSIMFPRSSNFTPLANILQKYYRDPVDRQLLLVLIQHFFDPVDPGTYAPYLVKSPDKFSVPPKRILIQEGIGDAQVPNMATRFWVRTLGIPGLKPLFEPVFGIKEVDAPIDGSGYVQYGPKPTPYPPEGNIPAKPNPTHGRVRRTRSAIEQMKTFFKKGEIAQYCKGVCDPN